MKLFGEGSNSEHLDSKLSPCNEYCLLNVSWSIRDQSDLESTLATRRCISSSSREETATYNTVV